MGDRVLDVSSLSVCSSSGAAVRLLCPPTNITRLPIDTLILILSLLPPKDVISLRRTCQVVSAATRLRTVWINVLRTVCREAQIFEGTYPIREMTVSELEYAATCHNQFLVRLWKVEPNQPPLAPVSIRILKLHASTPGVGEYPFGYFRNSAIVPGGRFLITATSTNIVQLWDLGFTPRIFINPCPLASAHVDALHDDFDILLQPSSDGTGVRVLFVLNLFGHTEFAVYEIFPTSDTPYFHRLAVLQQDNVDVDTYTIFGDRFSYHGDHHVVVWDYILDRAIKWEYNPLLSDVIFSDDDLICAGLAEYAIFRIPPLEDHTSGIVDAGPLFPILRIACPLYDSAVSSQTCWRPNASRVEYFDSIGEEDDGSVTVSRYVLKPIANDPGDGLPRSLPHIVDWFRDQMLPFQRTRFTSWKLSEDDRLIAWMNELSVNIHLSATTKMVDESIKKVSGVLWRWPIFQEDKHYSFCPISGRLCVSSWDHEIRILDYIMPPK